MIEPNQEQEKAISEKPKKGVRNYTLSDKALAQRQANNDLKSKEYQDRKLATQTNLSVVVNKLSQMLTEEDLRGLTPKDMAWIASLLYDKLYGKEKEHAPVQAIQINIKTPGENPDDKLMLDIKPGKV